MTATVLGARAESTDHDDPAALADRMSALALINCFTREVADPAGQARPAGRWLHLRLPHTDVDLRVRIRRHSPLGHRLSGPVQRLTGPGWVNHSAPEVCAAIDAELSARSGRDNPEFAEQVRCSQAVMRTYLQVRTSQAPHPDPFVAAEQSLVHGHRFHPSPKARCGPGPASMDPAHFPECHTSFRLRLVAVPTELIREDTADAAASAALAGLTGPAPDGHRLLPVHPHQLAVLAARPGPVRRALRTGVLRDLGPGGPRVAPTASVRTVYDPAADVFVKLSLNVRITNCVRRLSGGELRAAVALTRAMAPVAADLGARFPATVLLREPAYRGAAVRAEDRDAVGELGVLVREGLRGRMRAGLTAVPAAALAEERPTGGIRVSDLLRRGREQGRRPMGSSAAGSSPALSWWRRYVRLLIPPVLHAYTAHGVILEPHLQNVLVGVGADGFPAQVLFRDLEGTRLRADAPTAARLPADLRDSLSVSTQAGWSRMAYCLLVNHVGELAAAVGDHAPECEPTLWRITHDVVAHCAAAHGSPPELTALLADTHLPAKANLLTRWDRQADRHAGYVPVPNPLRRFARR